MRVRMPFQGRYERFRKLQREKMGEQITDRAPCDEMEKGDGLAMLIAAMITIVPICRAVMAVLALAGYVFSVRSNDRISEKTLLQMRFICGSVFCCFDKTE